MHFLVCLKQVPDTSEVRIDPVTNTLMREGVPSIINPYDAHALEEAIQLKQRVGGRVTILCMGPPQAKEALKKAMSFGADRAILLTDRAFAGSDSWATAYIISRAILKIHEADPVDVVLAGKEAIDGDTAQTGPGIAVRLGFPQLTYVIKVSDINEQTITVHRKLESGKEVVQAQLPALLTCEKTLNEISYASLPNMMKAAAYEPEVWSVQSAEFDPAYMGLKGSPTSVSRIFAPPSRTGGEKFDGTTDPKGAVSKVVQHIFEANILVGKGAKG